MSARSAAVLMILFAVGTQAWAGVKSRSQAFVIPREIRVRVDEGTAVARVRGFDLRIYSAGAATRPALPSRQLASAVSSREGMPDLGGGATRLVATSERESEWELRCQDGRVRAHRISGGARIGQSWLDLPEPVVIRSPSGFLQYDKRPYREELRVYTTGSLCEVVNEVGLEKYLEGLVNAEFSSRWNEEAIGAQVIAARTYALYQMKQAGEAGAHYDIDATTHDQVYDGSMKEDARAARIVERTRGWVLTVKTPRGLEPLKAYYHANCGGTTELPQEVWGTSNAGFRRVRCPYSANSPGSNWSFDLTAGQIVQAIGRASRGDVDLSLWPRDWRRLLLRGKLSGISVDGYDASGRVKRVTLRFLLDGGMRAWSMSGSRFRQLTGPGKFKSTAFLVQFAPGAYDGASGSSLSWRFSGHGNGHGVGMCQWGAKVMGERGFKTAAILKFYYPDAQLRKF